MVRLEYLYSVIIDSKQTKGRARDMSEGGKGSIYIYEGSVSCYVLVIILQKQQYLQEILSGNCKLVWCLFCWGTKEFLFHLPKTEHSTFMRHAKHCIFNLVYRIHLLQKVEYFHQN